MPHRETMQRNLRSLGMQDPVVDYMLLSSIPRFGVVEADVARITELAAYPWRWDWLRYGEPSRCALVRGQGSRSYVGRDGVVFWHQEGWEVALKWLVVSTVGGYKLFSLADMEAIDRIVARAGHLSREPVSDLLAASLVAALAPSQWRRRHSGLSLVLNRVLDGKVGATATAA